MNKTGIQKSNKPQIMVFEFDREKLLAAERKENPPIMVFEFDREKLLAAERKVSGCK